MKLYITRHQISVKIWGLILLAAMSLVAHLILANTARAELSESRIDPAIRHLAEARGISLDEASKRISWQDKAFKLDSKLSKELPSEYYGGSWIGSDDRVKIGVISSKDADNRSRNATSNFVDSEQLSDVTDFIQVQYSYSQLKVAASRISKVLDGSNKASEWPIQVGIKPSDNRILVSLPPQYIELSNSQKKALELAQSEFGSMLSYDNYPERLQNASCGNIYCSEPIRGGVGLGGSLDYTALTCSLGFIVEGNSGTRYVLTAGHCSVGGNGWATKNANGTVIRKIGPIHRNEDTHMGVDAMIVQIKPEYSLNSRGWVFIRDGTGLDGFSGPSRNEEYVINEADTSGGLEGSRVCLAAAVTSSSCGSVHVVDTTLTLDGITSTNLVRASFCGNAGDSGGPVIRTGKALGIYKAGDLGSCNTWHYYTGIIPIFNRMDNTIHIVAD